MLWKKESRQPNALYIDIFKQITEHTTVQTPLPEKSDSIALEKRNEGNVRFRDSAALKAMELYSDSLRFAKPGSEHISLAYANRSACFLKMKMYDECLIDIDYAMAAGYPEHLRPKLEDRKARCLEEMQENPQHPREKLTIEPDEKFPCLSNVAMIQRDGAKGGYAVVAKTDIDVGQPIAIEDAYHPYLSHSFGSYCIICAKEFCNLVPCDKCAVAMFCPECQGHFLHEHECGLNFCEEENCDYNTDVMDLVRGVLLVLKLFPTADDLMSFVEQMLKKPNQLPASMLDDRSKYQVYFNNPLKQTVKSLDHINQKLSSVFNTLLRIPHVKEMFKTTKHRRFLMHLIGHHMTIPGNSSGMLMGVGAPSPLGAPVRASMLVQTYFKHSCDPNVFDFINGGKTIWFSLKPIRKDEQLVISCVPSELTTKERKKFLMNMLKIKCECSRCQSKAASPAQRQQLVSDPAFRFIEANVKSINPLVFNSKHVEPLMHAFLEVLRKYGRLDWCEELAFIFAWFKTLYNIRSLGGGVDFNHPLAREILLHCDGKCKCSNCNVD